MNSRAWIALFSIAGLGIMSYLTYLHYANAQSFCDLSQEVSCDIVTTSIYSEIFGIPVSVLGIFYFGGVLLLTAFNHKKKILQTVFLLTVFALIPSLYLLLTELLFIKSICILCETSKVLMAAILVTSYLAVRDSKKISLKLVAPVIIAGLVAAGVSYFAQAGGVTRQDYSELIACLNQKGVGYYK